MERWHDKVAIVTGASSGIGASITEKLIENGIKVVGLARRLERLQQLSEKLADKNCNFYPLVADITKEEDILNAFLWSSQNVGHVHILINNAGIREQTNLTDGNSDMWKKVLDTNVIGVCIATREAIRIMRRHNIDGHIVNINSLCGHQVPNSVNMNVYPASKHAVTALTETLRQELVSLKSKIKVSSVSPGSVATEILDRFIIDPEILEKRKKSPILKPEDVADAVLYVLSTPPHVQVTELTLRVVE